MHAVLLDKMKHDPDFDAAEKASDPLLLMNVIEKTSWPRRKTSFHFLQCMNKRTHCLPSTKVPSPTHNGMRGGSYRLQSAKQLELQHRVLL
jgi:hypothetical protein